MGVKNLTRVTTTALCLLTAACGSAGAQGSIADSPSASEMASPPSPHDITKEVPALWALDRVSADRTEVVIRVAGGGCLTYIRTDVQAEGDSQRLSAVNRVPTASDVACTADFTGFPHRVTLPRPLRAGEEPAGECDSTGDGIQANYCNTLKDIAAAARQPHPTAQPLPPTEVKW